MSVLYIRIGVEVNHLIARAMCAASVNHFDRKPFMNQKTGRWGCERDKEGGIWHGQDIWR